MILFCSVFRMTTYRTHSVKTERPLKPWQNLNTWNTSKHLFKKRERNRRQKTMYFSENKTKQQQQQQSKEQNKTKTKQYKNKTKQNKTKKSYQTNARYVLFPFSWLGRVNLTGIGSIFDSPFELGFDLDLCYAACSKILSNLNGINFL